MSSLKDKLEKKPLAVPLLVGIALFCVLGLAMAPMMHATPKNVPLAIVNLDEGVTLPTGATTNAGDLLSEKVQSAAQAAAESGSGSPIAWTELTSEDELNEAMEANEVYGAIVIPADFTQTQAAAQKPRVTVKLNLAASPMLAQTMQSTLTTMLTQAGLQPNVETRGNADTSESPFASMMGVQFMVMPLFIMSMIIGIAGSVLLWPRTATRRERGGAVLKQLGYGACGSLVAAVSAYGIVAWAGGVAVSANAILLLWLASFCIMVATIGLCDIAVPLGVPVMLCVFALGMSTAVLPAPMLPDAWVNWVLPWAPQAVIGAGLRDIMYLNAQPFATGTATLLAWGAAGVAAMLVALAPQGAHRKTHA